MVGPIRRTLDVIKGVTDKDVRTGTLNSRCVFDLSGKLLFLFRKNEKTHCENLSKTKLSYSLDSRSGSDRFVME